MASSKREIASRIYKVHREMLMLARSEANRVEMSKNRQVVYDVSLGLIDSSISWIFEYKVVSIDGRS